VDGRQHEEGPARGLPGAKRASAEVAIDVFAEKYATKYDKAVECLTKDRNTLLALYDFPAEHWDHLRTTNPLGRFLRANPLRRYFLGVRVGWSFIDAGFAHGAARRLGAGAQLHLFR
jgi:hypothetical protein